MGFAIQNRNSAQPPDERAEVRLDSRLDGPVELLSFLKKSLLFAELSQISYLSRSDAGRAALEVGLPEVRFYDRDGAQAYLFGNETDAIVVCRGTEPQEWNDVKADLDAATAVAETVGRVHRGFKGEVDDLWPRLEHALVNNNRTLWFAGHSLGGAMAAICAGRCKLSHIRSDPRALFTFGAPRVGDRRYVNYVSLEIYRWVNNNDIVPRVPPSWLGFRHVGSEVYLNANGKIRRMHGWQRLTDRLRGTLRGLRRGKLDPLADHSLGEYVRHIRHAVHESQTGQLTTNIPGVRIDPPQQVPTPHRAVVRSRVRQ